jgi:hypothetical protein
MEPRLQGMTTCGGCLLRNSVLSAILLLVRPSAAQETTNSWIKPSSGYWEEASSWSLGVLPDQSQLILLTNAGWKAIAIGANTAQNFPQSMQVQSLRLGGPADSYNVLLMNFSGFERPLQTGSLVVESNSAVVVQSSSLQVLSSTNDAGNLTLGGSFNQGDFSQVQVQGTLDLGSLREGSYTLTNGTLTATRETLGGGVPGKFIQYGGSNNVSDLEISQNGEYDLYDGEMSGSSFTIGVGGVSASFFQYGGNVNAEIVIGAQGGGRYVLNAGTVSGRMSIPSQDRGTGYMEQIDGTNFASSLEMGKGNRFGGQGAYVLSNGLVTVSSSTVLRGFGDFYQANGRHTIASNLVMQGSDLFIYGAANARYSLLGGTVSAQALTMSIALFDQESGTNLIAGDVVIGPGSLSSLYSLYGGFLSDSNLILNASLDSGFHQTGGVHEIVNQLTIQGEGTNFWGYTLEGGSLGVKDISISNGAAFHHRGGVLDHSGALTLAQGEWQAAPGDQALGPLRLAAAQFANSAIPFPEAPSTLRLGNSSAEQWFAEAVLCIANWHGSASGGGTTQLYFGYDSSGLTKEQLAQIQFKLPGGLYPARILTNGEVVPEIAPALAVSRSGNALNLTWGQGWTLQSSTNVAGPYEDVASASGSYTALATHSQEFFRLRQ